MSTTQIGRTSFTGWVSGVSFLCAVAALTLAIRAHDLPLTPFAASASKIAAGEVWVLPASALVVDRPVAVGLVAFILLGLAALATCGARVFWIVAVAGHVGSTLAVYAIIGASRLADPHVFTSAAVTPDFGVSAMQGAWVGALTATAWNRTGANRRARAFVVAGVFALAAAGWWLHPDPSILTSEHLLAFLIGCGVVSWQRLSASTRAPTGRLVVSVPQGRAARGTPTRSWEI